MDIFVRSTYFQEYLQIYRFIVSLFKHLFEHSLDNIVRSKIHYAWQVTLRLLVCVFILLYVKPVSRFVMKTPRNINDIIVK